MHELGATDFWLSKPDHTDLIAARELLGSMDKLGVQIVEASEQSERLTLADALESNQCGEGR
jgi:16S rRNA U1498 N3-methylase RsmE